MSTALTTSDLLTLAGAFAIFIVGIALALALFELAMTLRDARRVIHLAEYAGKLVNSLLEKPVAIAQDVQQGIRNVIQRFAGAKEDDTDDTLAEEVEDARTDRSV